MATEHTGPAADDRSDYDYRTGTETIPAGLAGLSDLVAGDVRFDEYSKQLYATDASAYEVTPIGVVYPTSTTDVATVMRHCADHGIPVMPRGGGTSLAGQATNEAVVLDFTRYMTEVFAVDADERTASAEVGVYLGDLNAECEPHGLKFGPDPAWGDKSALGGAIGNNTTGAHSLVYEKTDAYIEEVEAVLADGTVTTFGEITLDELRDRADPEGDLEGRIHAIVAEVIDEHAETVEEAYPDLTRNVSGYNLDWIVEEAMEAKRAIAEGGEEAEGTINLARLLAGSEGTLAIVTEATVALVEVPETKAVALLTYPDLLSAMRDVAPILEHGPAAVEAMDDVLLELARQTEEFGPVVATLPDGTDSVLLVEFYAESVEEGQQKVADLLADRVPGTEPDVEPSEGAAETTDAPVEATTAMEAYDAARRAQFWKMRKSGLPILLSRTSDEKHIAFIEDTAIPAEHLPAFVEGFEEILAEEGTFASYYAHAGPGVLHIRPLINTKTEEGLASFEAIADGVTDLVVEYGGSVSGEHGDGRARTQWNRKLYGDEVFSLFEELKTAFDPDWLLNPGQVCGDVAMTENLRFDPDYEFDAGFDPVLNWENENGFQGMVELCHGCGGCRGPQATTGGVMCPTFRAAEEEITSTRGRANMLRQAMSGDLPADEQFTDEFVTEVLDLCIGCKGCKIDCPSGVDMAKLKAEVTHEYHRRNGAEARSKLFANFDRLAPLASATAPVSNLLTSLPGSGLLAEKTMGIARERSLPEFQRETLVDWFEARDGSSVPSAEADRRALLVPDSYTNHVHPEVGRAAVRVLENAGVHVEIPEEIADSGRAAFSKGFLDEAGELATENVTALAPLIEEGWDVVVAEPSDAVMFQSDYRDLLSGRFVDLVSENTYGVMEYIDTFGLEVPDGTGERLTYHGHCHQKATAKDHHTAAVLTKAGFEVDVLDSGCCGMAGSFGYEAEHYAMSQAIGRILFSQIDASGGRVVAPGTSCRTQIGDEYGEEPPHPIETLAASL